MKSSLLLILLTATMPAFAGWFEQPPARQIVIVNNGKQYTVGEADVEDNGFQCIAGTPIHMISSRVNGVIVFSRVVLNGFCYIKGAKS